MKYHITKIFLIMLATFGIGVQSSYAAACSYVGVLQCQIDQQITNPNTVLNVGGFVKHSGNNTNTIRLLCPVSITDLKFSKARSLTMLFEDVVFLHGGPHGDNNFPEVTRGPSNIEAHLRRVTKHGLNETLISIDTYSGFQDNPTFLRKKSTPQESTYFMAFNPSFKNINLDEDDILYIQVDLKRPNISMHPAVTGFRVCGS